ncbi:MAG: hypothetical protein R3326_02950 [Gemmatimonadota bacterium]|nr:hypothetical protein [Gemmatimonadota bacterium]
MRRIAGTLAVAMALLTMVAACEDENPFRNTTPRVTTGVGQVWELDLGGFPSGWVFASGERFFVGTGSTPSNGTWVLDAGPDGTLVFRPFEDLAPGLSRVRTAILDLTVSNGVQTFEAVTTVPETGYRSEPVEVVEGHVYAFRMSTLGGVVIPINYGKLEVVEVGRETPGDERSRFVLFRWAYQNQPLNRNLRVEEQ